MCAYIGDSGEDDLDRTFDEDRMTKSWHSKPPQTSSRVTGSYCTTTGRSQEDGFDKRCCHKFGSFV